MSDTERAQPPWLSALSPVLTETIRVPLGAPVRTRMGVLIPDVLGAVVRFPQWTGPAFVDDFNRKSAAFVELDGEHVFAELAVLRLLERHGWEGRWVTTTGAKHGEIFKLLTRWQDLPRDQQRHAPIEDERARRLLATIAAVNKPARYAGCWDVYAWRGEQFLFLECKRAAGAKIDPVKPPQAEWMRMAMACQPALLTAQCFGVVRWDYAV